MRLSLATNAFYAGDEHFGGRDESFHFGENNFGVGDEHIEMC